MVFGRFVRRRTQTPERTPTLDDIARKTATVDKKLLKRRGALDISTSRLFEFFAENGIIDADPSQRTEQGIYAVSELHSYGLEARSTGMGGVLIFDTLDGATHGYRLVRVPKYST